MSCRLISRCLSALIAITATASFSSAYALTDTFINEIHYDNSGTDIGEAIEIAGPAGTDISGWSIVLYNGANGLSYNTLTLSGVLNDDTDGYGFQSQSLPTNGIQNGAPDGLALVDQFNNVVQFLSYEGTLIASDGPAAGIESEDIGISESSSTPVGSSLQLVGHGNYAEEFEWVAASGNSFGAVNSGQHFGADNGNQPASFIVINEFDADNASTDTAEFIELYDGGIGGISLDGLIIVLYNGSDDSSYRVIDLDGYSTTPDGYFVVCGNVSNVTNCHLETTPNSNLIQNGADAIALLVGNADDYPNDTPLFPDNIVDAVVYGTNDSNDDVLLALLNEGQPQLNDSQQESLQRCDNGTGGQRNTASFQLRIPTPGIENDCGSETSFHYISDIQGAGESSSLVGTSVMVEAVVVGDFQAENELDGFFIQEEPADHDDNPLSSEGLFVYAPGGADVNIGDLVRITGNVSEFFDMTQLNNVTEITVLAQHGNLNPTEIMLPFSTEQALEAVEGMLVYFPQPLAISEYFNYDRFGEMVLALPEVGQTRLYQPTAVVEPGSAAVSLQAANDLRSVILDDYSTVQNPAILRHPNGLPFSTTNRFRGGDVVSNLVGVVDYRFSEYRIQPTEAANYTATNLRESHFDAPSGDLHIASFNVLNYFTTIDDGSAICGPNVNLGCRGADDSTEFTRQKTKIVSAMTEINADIIGLVEIENNASESIADLTNGLNAQLNADVYEYINTGTIGTDAIKVGIVYKPDSVQPIGNFAVLDESIDARFIDSKNRPALAQSFVDLTTGARFTVVVNHFKSKGSACDDVGDSNNLDGQGNCNGTRENAAFAEIDWLATFPTGIDDSDILVLGDLNAYAKEDPIMAFTRGSDGVAGSQDDFIDLINFYNGSESYSYVFSGQFGYLDYALASRSLLPQVVGITEWHINADEPDVFDYNTSFRPPEQIALYEENAFRSSDHDPVIVGLSMVATIEEIKAFFDDAVINEEITGTSPRGTRNTQLITRLLGIASSVESNSQRFACSLMRFIGERVDGQPAPADYIEGPQSSVFANMLLTKRLRDCN